MPRSRRPPCETTLHNKARMSPNLFSPTGPVFGPSFHGREAAIAAVTTRMESGHSVVILGQRRIGKTSLLRALCEFRQPQLAGAHILHDGFLGSGGKVELLARHIASQLEAKGLGLPRKHKDNIAALNDWGRRLAARGERLIIYLNDIDDILYASQVGADDIERLLRGLIEAGHTVVCATSYLPLDRRDNAHERAQLSNVLYPCTLAAWTENEARSFLAERSLACGSQLSSDEISLILSLSGRVPFYLQRVGWNLYANTSFADSTGTQRLDMIVAAIDEHYKSLEPLIQSALDHLPSSSARCLVRAAKGGVVEESADARFLIGRGLLDVGDNPFGSQGSMVRELLKEMVDLVEDGRVEPTSSRRWLGRLAESTIQTMIDAAVRTYLGS